MLDDPFYIDVHSVNNTRYLASLQKISDKTSKNVYAIFDNGVLIYNRKDNNLEIENKCKNKNGEEIIKEWLDKLKFDINKAYRLSWDDKYRDLCKEQNIEVSNIVRFNNIMPDVKEDFNT